MKSIDVRLHCCEEKFYTVNCLWIVMMTILMVMFTKRMMMAVEVDKLLPVAPLRL